MQKNRIWQLVAILAACVAFGCGSADDESRADLEKAADRAAEESRAGIEKAADGAGAEKMVMSAEELARRGAAARAARDALAAERGVANDVAAHGVEGAVDAAGDAYDTVIDEAEVKDRDE